MNQLICGDCLEIILTLPNESIDLVVTSPPYNVDLGNNKYRRTPYDLYRDNLEHGAYIAWLRSIFAHILWKLASGGRIAINIGDGKNGRVPTHSDLMQMLSRDLPYLPMATIVWNKSQTGNRTSWGSWLSPSMPSFPTPFEYVLVFAKDSLRLQTQGETDLTRDEFMAWSLALWSFPGETKAKALGHPAPFPEELPRRLIKMLTWKGAVVLDPFMGVGTACVAAKRLGRGYVGIELSPEYYETARQRIEEIP